MIANYLQILWSIILEIIFFGSYPHWLSLVGACFILVNAGLAIYKAATASNTSQQSTKENEKGTNSSTKKNGKYVMISSSKGNEEHVSIKEDYDGEEDHHFNESNGDDDEKDGIRLETIHTN